MRTLKLSDATKFLKVPYMVLYSAVVSGRIPAQRDFAGNRWVILIDDLPLIAKILREAGKNDIGAKGGHTNEKTV